MKMRLQFMGVLMQLTRLEGYGNGGKYDIYKRKTILPPFFSKNRK